MPQRAVFSLADSMGCRFCDNQTYMADNEGPLHPCCEFWFVTEGLDYCPACRSSAGARRGESSRQTRLDKNR